jgi:glycosyltransferase involved in cell wall biosynthesis
MDILYSLTLKRCDHIIAVSKCTKNDIIECYGIAEKKIEVIYNGVEEGFRQVEKQEALNIVAKANLVLPEKFVLFIGTLEPRKNVLTLIKAFDRIKEKGIVEELVIIGKKGWLFEETLEYLRCSKFNSQIHYLGHVEDYALPSIYSLAEIFVYPSLYEGFGYPILEAMACGTPVITNSTPALLEVLDGAGSVVDATSVDILAEAIVHLIDNKTLQKQFQDRGLTRARELSVRKKAEATLGMYKRISN